MRATLTTLALTALTTLTTAQDNTPIFSLTLSISYRTAGPAASWNGYSLSAVPSPTEPNTRDLLFVPGAGTPAYLNASNEDGFSHLYFIGDEPSGDGYYQYFGAELPDLGDSRSASVPIQASLPKAPGEMVGSQAFVTRDGELSFQQTSAPQELAACPADGGKVKLQVATMSGSSTALPQGCVRANVNVVPMA